MSSSLYSVSALSLPQSSPSLYLSNFPTPLPPTLPPSISPSFIFIPLPPSLSHSLSPHLPLFPSVTFLPLSLLPLVSLSSTLSTSYHYLSKSVISELECLEAMWLRLLLARERRSVFDLGSRCRHTHSRHTSEKRDMCTLHVCITVCICTHAA